MAAAIELGEEGMTLFRDNLRYVAEAEKIAAPPAPEWATANRILLELDTMRLRDFSTLGCKHTQTPVLIDAPYAGHSSTIADYAKGQSLVETFQAAGLEHVLVTDWKSATDAMKDFDIDKYLTDINTAVDHPLSPVDLASSGGGDLLVGDVTSQFWRHFKFPWSSANQYNNLPKPEKTSGNRSCFT